MEKLAERLLEEKSKKEQQWVTLMVEMVRFL